jgi:hypothetical protein
LLQNLRLPPLDISQSDAWNLRMHNCRTSSIWAVGANISNAYFRGCQLGEIETQHAKRERLTFRHVSKQLFRTPLQGPWCIDRSTEKKQVTQKSMFWWSSRGYSTFSDSSNTLAYVAAAICHDGSRVAAISPHGFVAAWEIASGNLLWSRVTRPLGSLHVRSICFDRDDHELLVRYTDGSYSVFLMADGSEHQQNFAVDAMWSECASVVLPGEDASETSTISPVDPVAAPSNLAGRPGYSEPFVSGQNARLSVSLFFGTFVNAVVVEGEVGDQHIRRFLAMCTQAENQLVESGVSFFFPATACFDAEGRLVDYDEEAADTWLRYLGNGYPQPVEAAWCELDEFGRVLGPKKAALEG